MHNYFVVVETAHGDDTELYVMDTMEDMIGASENAVLEYRMNHPEHYGHSLCVKVSEAEMERE
jgi:hypothetical protein